MYRMKKTNLITSPRIPPIYSTPEGQERLVSRNMCGRNVGDVGTKLKPLSNTLMTNETLNAESDTLYVCEVPRVQQVVISET